MKTTLRFLLPALLTCASLTALGAAPIDTDSPAKPTLKPKVEHSDKCAGCSAEAVWGAFVDYLRETGHEDLIPEDLQPLTGDETSDLEMRAEFQASLVRSDPVKGVLFKLSPALVNLDALFHEAGAEPLSAESLAKARELAASLRDSKNPYLAPYGLLFGAQMDLQAGDCAQAVKALEGLSKSCFFLPRKEAHRHLARGYSCAGDDTLALLELQFYMLDLPSQDETDRHWAQDELKKIRDKKHPGPLHQSEESMRSISTLIDGHDVGEPTQSKERRVEEILEKVATLLEKKAGACENGVECPNAKFVLVEGEGDIPMPGHKPGQKPQQAKGKKKGQTKQNKGDPNGAKETKLDQDEAADMALRDATPEEKDAWGKINDRETARSLKELWDKIPQSYRLMVTQYFKDLSDPDSAKTAGK